MSRTKKERYRDTIESAYNDGRRDALDGVTAIVRLEYTIPNNLVCKIGKVSIADGEVEFAEVEQDVIRRDRNTVAAIKFFYNLIKEGGET
jgi:hypothetical protein